MNLEREGYPAVLDMSKLRTVFGVSRWTLRDWVVEKKLSRLEWFTLPNGRLAATRSSVQRYLDAQIDKARSLIGGTK